MGSVSEDRGVLFVDISDSTKIYSELGNEGAQRVVVQTLDLLAATVEAHDGTVVDRIGDELMCTFPAAPATAAAAIALQWAIRRAVNEPDLPDYLGVRIGFHFGSILRDGERIFGDTVYIARRMASLAKAHQILSTAETVAVAVGVSQSVRLVDRTRIKGRRKLFKVYEIVWDPEIATFVEAELSATVPVGKSPELIVWYDGEEFRLDLTRPQLTIGRNAACDIHVDDQRVSRLHARIEFRKTSFYISDSSTNGTFVIEAPGKAPIRLHRKAHRLRGEGSILLTRPGQGTELVLEYRTDRSDNSPSIDSFSQEIR